MSPALPPRIMLLACLGVFCLFSCVKNIENSLGLTPPPADTTTIDYTPAVTAIGTPVGTAVTKTIGPAGGSITSADGQIDLTIPAGALSTNTNISIQPVTNTCPGGIGLSYDLLPNGTTFLTPALLTFHYTDDSINGADPLLLYCVFQDSLNQWEIDDAVKEIDSVAKTVSFDIQHFSKRGLQPGVRITGTKDVFKSAEAGTFRIERWIKPKNGSRLIPSESFQDSKITYWAVNGAPGGSEQDGILGEGWSTSLRVQYTAPPKIDEDRKVGLSVELDAEESIRTRQKGTRTITTVTFNHHTYFHNIKLLGDSISFEVKVYVNVNGTDLIPSNFQNALYHDVTTMIVNVAHGKVDIPEATLVNEKPQVIPDHDGDLQNGPGYIWIPDATGIVNIKTAIGQLLPYGDGTTGVALLFTGSGITPQYTIIDPILGSYSTGGDPTDPAWPGAITFILKDSAQSTPKSLGLPPGFGWDIKPRH